MARKQTIFDAIASGDPARVKRKLSREPESIGERDTDGLSPILRALYDGQDEIVEVLLARAPQLDVHEASALGRVEDLRRALGRSRRRASAYSDDGFTPLHLAAFFGRPEAVDVLLERGADLEARSRNRRIPGVAPLHSAIAGGQTQTALLLLERGADPNAVAPGGWTPLHFAATMGDVDVCRALLKRRAKRHPLAEDRTRPLDFAIERRHHDVVALLKGGRG